MRGGESGHSHRAGRSAIVDGDEAETGPVRPAMHDGRQASLQHRIEDRVVVDGGPQHHGVHGRLADPGGVPRPSSARDQGQAEPVLDADGRDASKELRCLRVVEGVGQMLTEDDAEGRRAPATQRAGAGVWSDVAQALRGP
jgi:hypothetical protein